MKDVWCSAAVPTLHAQVEVSNDQLVKPSKVKQIHADLSPAHL